MSKILHYQSDFLDTMRLTTDPLADATVQAFYAEKNVASLTQMLAQWQYNSEPIPDRLPDSLKNYLQQTSALPAWADKHKMQTGAQFFSRFGGELLMMLGMLSLPYDYAAAKGAQVLYFSQRLYGDPGKRLAETGQYVVDITAKDAFGLKGKAFRSIQKVRLMHAAVRYHLGKSGQWQESLWDKPINQEDMAGTNLSIALLPIRGLRKIGWQITHEDMMAYIHLWNVASYLMGVDERLLPETSKEAFVLEKMIATRQQAPSEAGKVLTAALLNYTQQQVDGSFSKFMPIYMRYLLGDQLADWLEIPRVALPAGFSVELIKNMNRLRSFLPSLYPSSSNDMFIRLIRQQAADSKSSFAVPANLHS